MLQHFPKCRHRCHTKILKPSSSLTYLHDHSSSCTQSKSWFCCSFALLPGDVITNVDSKWRQGPANTRRLFVDSPISVLYQDTKSVCQMMKRIPEEISSLAWDFTLWSGLQKDNPAPFIFVWLNWLRCEQTNGYCFVAFKCCKVAATLRISKIMNP